MTRQDTQRGKKKRLSLGGFLFISFSCFAGAAHGHVQEETEVYRVQPGDSLWQIAEEKLHSPWLWQDLLADNPDLEHPYLIYPGDEIVVSHKSGKQKVTIRRQKEGCAERANSPSTFYDPRTGKVLPKKRIGQADAPIPIIPLSNIKPFFHNSKILSTKKPLEPWPTIQALKGEHLVVGKEDGVYAAPVNYPVGSILYIFRLGKDIDHPSTREYLGTEAIVLGEAEITAVSPDKVGTLRLLSSFREIKTGDFLMLGDREPIYPYFMPKKPRHKHLADGQIVDVIDGVSQISQYQIVTITGGHNRKRRAGDVLTIWHERTDAPVVLPKEPVGKLMVFGVYDSLSYALVVKATQAIYLLDSVASP